MNKIKSYKNKSAIDALEQKQSNKFFKHETKHLDKQARRTLREEREEEDKMIHKYR